MTACTANRIVWGGAAVATIAGLLAAWYALAALPPARVRLAQDAVWFGQLQELQTRIRESEGARETVERLATDAPAPIETVLEGLAGTSAPDDLRRRHEPVADEWVLHLVDLTFNDAAIAPVMRMIEAAEMQRPPWRLRAFDIQASPHGQGWARMTVTLGRLARKD